MSHPYFPFPMPLSPVRNPDFVDRNAFTVNSGRGSSLTVCFYCNEEIQRLGEDYLTYCESCCLIEGKTIELEDEE